MGTAISSSALKRIDASAIFTESEMRTTRKSLWFGIRMKNDSKIPIRRCAGM